MRIWFQRLEKTQYRLLATSSCLLYRKVWQPVRIDSFWSKIEYFTDQNGPKGKPQGNEFGLFSNSDINVTNRVEKVDEKNCHLSSFHVPFLSYGPKIV